MDESKLLFENDVKMYGIQTVILLMWWMVMFENDVKIYGIQTPVIVDVPTPTFENDVKMYGIQTNIWHTHRTESLRMM